MPREQPDEDTKLRTLRGERTGWDYVFRVPPVPHAQWSAHDWIRYIGDHWYRTHDAEAPLAPVLHSPLTV